MQVYVEFNDGKWVEAAIYGASETNEANMKLSLFHLFAQNKVCHRRDVRDITDIWYNSVSHNFPPYAISHFERRIKPRLLVTVRARFLEAMRVKEANPEMSLVCPDTGALLWDL